MTEASARTPAAVAWPEKIITQAEAFGLAASWPVRASVMIPLEGVIELRTGMPRNELPDIDLLCAADNCGIHMGQLRRGGVTYNGSLDEMLSMVLRHMVMVHDVSLAGLRKQDNGAAAGSTPAPAGRAPGPGVTPEQYAGSWEGRHGR